jgi:hypothetical protein
LAKKIAKTIKSTFRHNFRFTIIFCRVFVLFVEYICRWYWSGAKGRLSIAYCLLSLIVVFSWLSGVVCRVLPVDCRGSVVGCCLSIVGSRLSGVACRLSGVGCRVLPVDCRGVDCRSLFAKSCRSTFCEEKFSWHMAASRLRFTATRYGFRVEDMLAMRGLLPATHH